MNLKARACTFLILQSFLCANLPLPALAEALQSNSGQAPNEDSLPIPKTPTAPPTLFRRTPPETFRCQRSFNYDGKTYGCDSNVRSDGEGLRPLIKDIPEANIELNNYQRRKLTLENTAYMGSLGILLLIAGFVWPTGSNLDSSGNVSPPAVRSLMIWGGAGIFAGSLFYGYTANRSNENKLAEAVQIHNEKKPDKPILIQFSTGLNL